MSEPEFCDECGVTMNLHDGEGSSCEYAQSKARILEMFYAPFARAARNA